MSITFHSLFEQSVKGYVQFAEQFVIRVLIDVVLSYERLISFAGRLFER